MPNTINTPQTYIAQLEPVRQAPFLRIWHILQQHIPKGFQEQLSYGMPGFVVPHTLYPAGYHADPALPLPFVSLAAQKNYISLYYMGFMDETVLEWFTAQWEQVAGKQPDIGKCCLRFKKTTPVPDALLGQLAAKLTPEQWIRIYEKGLGK